MMNAAKELFGDKIMVVMIMIFSGIFSIVVKNNVVWSAISIIASLLFGIIVIKMLNFFKRKK